LDVLEPDVLDAYLRWGFHDRADGAVELACAPAVEARLFDAAAAPDGARLAFDHLPEMRGRTTIVRGKDTDLPSAVFRAQARAADAPLLELPGDHFFLQSDPARAEGLVREHL